MLEAISKLSATALLLVMSIGTVGADEKQAKDFIMESLPYLHMSCEGFVANYGKDEKKMEEIVGLMVAVSFINREIDATKVLVSEDDRAEFGEYLEKALTSSCTNDVQSLMVTNVDRAVVFAFDDKIQIDGK